MLDFKEQKSTDCMLWLHGHTRSADNTDCAMQHADQILTVRGWRIYNLYLMVKTQQMRGFHCVSNPSK